MSSEDPLARGPFLHDCELAVLILASGAMTLVYEEARNFYGVEQYVLRLGTMMMRNAVASAGSTLAGQVLQLGNASAVLSAAAPETIIGAFSYNEHNLHPFDQLAGIASTTVGTVYLIIVSRT